MSHWLEKRAVRAVTLMIAIAVEVCTGSATISAASLEDEIARVDRARADLFEELVRTRVEAVAARAALENTTKALDQAEAELVQTRAEIAATAAKLQAAVKAREQAEAELARLREEVAMIEPVAQAARVQSNVEPQEHAIEPKAQPSAIQKRSLPGQALARSVYRSARLKPQHRGSRYQSPRRGGVWTGLMGGYGNARGTRTSNGPGVW